MAPPVLLLLLVVSLCLHFMYETFFAHFYFLSHCFVVLAVVFALVLLNVFAVVRCDFAATAVVVVVVAVVVVVYVAVVDHNFNGVALCMGALRNVNVDVASSCQCACCVVDVVVVVLLHGGPLFFGASASP